ncbi:MAG: cob(I)yrinic acid a,c-diamide adenosyltransferase [Ilumatobacteraceae bacterium]
MTDTSPIAPPQHESRLAPSLVLVSTGNGKGESTAAFGVMLRAVACGWKVAVVQFIKGGEQKGGEQKGGEQRVVEQQIAEQLGVDWVTLGDGFTWDPGDIGRDAELGRLAFARAAAIVRAGEHQLVILDDLTYLCTWDWVPIADVVAMVLDRPPHVNLIITGRDAPAELISAADTVTEMRNVKHAFDSGVAAKRGLDY